MPEQMCKGFEATNTNLVVVGTHEVKVGTQGHLQRQRGGSTPDQTGHPWGWLTTASCSSHFTLTLHCYKHNQFGTGV